MEQLLTVLPILGTLAALSALALRLLAYGMRMLGFVLRLRAWERHQNRLQAAPSEAARAALQPPPESPELPEGLSKHTVLVFALGSTAAGIGLIMRRPPAPPVVVQHQQEEPPSKVDPVELLVQRCETSQQCGAGCRCVEGNCRCVACDRKKGGRCTTPPAGKDQGSSSGSGSKAPAGPSSGLVRLWEGRKMAGDLAWAGTL